MTENGIFLIYFSLRHNEYENFKGRKNYSMSKNTCRYFNLEINIDHFSKRELIYGKIGGFREYKYRCERKIRDILKEK